MGSEKYHEEMRGEGAEEAHEAGIATQVERAEQAVQASLATLKGNIDRLPGPEAVFVEEYPGIREKLEKYHTDVLRSKEFFLSKLGILSGLAGGAAMNVVLASGGLNNAAPTLENGAALMAVSVGAGLVVTAVDQILTRLSAYLETREHKQELLGLKKRHV